MEENVNDKNVGESQIYEIGYHILPTVAEDKLPEEVGKVQSLISSRGGNIITEEFPQLRALAYDISKRTETKYSKYSKAYFGWIKFEIGPDMIIGVDNGLNENPNVLRYLIIKTVRENTMTTPKIVREKKEAKDGEKSEQEEKIEVSEEEIDKSIDDLVIN